MKALFLVLPSVLAMQTTEDHGTAMNLKGDIEGMKELFLSVSKSKIDEATRQAVAAMMREINTTLTSAVGDDMIFHEDTLDCKYDEIMRCTNERETFATNQNIAGFKNASDNGKVGHSTCRGTEQTQCNEMNGLKTTCDGQADALDRCRRNTDHWDSDSATVKKWMNCLNDQLAALNTIIATHDSYEAKCKTQCATRETCNGKQTAFEVKICNWLTKVDEMCYNYNVCYGDHVEQYEEAKTNAVKAWETATQQMTALTVLTCYGNSILENRTSLDHCNGIPCVGCPPNPCDEHCPEKPVPVPCNERTRPCDAGRELLPRPCEETFLAEEYTSQLGACTPAIECTTCHDYHTQPMWFAGRGQCVCNVGGTKDDLIPAAPAMDNAIACTEWCKADDFCRYASWNADTHECIGLRNMDSRTEERPTAWSCYTARFRERWVEDSS